MSIKPLTNKYTHRDVNIDIDVLISLIPDKIIS